MRKDRRYRFKININYEFPEETANWCKENFGRKHRKRWGHSQEHWNHNTKWHFIYFYINNKEDAVAFKLRWG